MRKNPWQTVLAMATLLTAILLTLTACASESADPAVEQQLSATLTAERQNLQSANEKLSQAQQSQGDAQACSCPSIRLEQGYGAMGSA